MFNSSENNEMAKRIMESDSHYTKYDIQRHLKDGITVYEDNEEEKETFVSNCEAGCIDRETAIDMWNDLYTARYEGKTYRMDFVL